MPLDTLNETCREQAQRSADAALEFVNEVRAEVGAEQLEHLVPGSPCKTGTCPIANSLFFATEDLIPVVTFWATVMRPASQLDGRWRLHGKPIRHFAHSQPVKDFIQNFDRGWLPELED
jgi:hypothetical protein